MPTVTSVRKGDYVVLTLNRPQVYNALDVNVLLSLSSCITVVANDPKVRVVVITGAGGKAFCVGVDRKERQCLVSEEVRAYTQKLSATLMQLASLSKPVIAAINGAALGSGLELALACDLRVAAKTAVFSCPEVGWGVIPSAGGTQRLSRLIGMSRAKEMILTTRRLGAKTAADWGLVHRLMETECVLQEAEDWAAEISRLAPLAVCQAKRSLDGGFGVSLAEGLQLEKRAVESLVGTRDRREGALAFAERRAPVYRGY
ncbi:enoyl-CoA hydratase-related protein [Pasteuria penetrans]|uniref:enoyl-CoA hydratase-related protein n=1 Tax=Pasteuria penetrans TaxID=86005 RepID=UPI000F9851EC|nr:enoyl-CoA hydratase-related protein [Pasteuria penetrans]